MILVARFLKRKYKIENTLAKNKFMLLITTILSQRSRDENTDRASKQLFSAAKTPRQILSLTPSNLEKLIKPAGMYRQKAKKIRAVCKAIIEKYKGRVPGTRSELLELYGVGYKTADIVLSYGFGMPTIAVDTHVNRISKRIGIVHENAGVEEVREVLERLVPAKQRYIVNIGLVRFGQTICKPVKPECPQCYLKMLCRYYRNVFIPAIF